MPEAGRRVPSLRLAACFIVPVFGALGTTVGWWSVTGVLIIDALLCAVALVDFVLAPTGVDVAREAPPTAIVGAPVPITVTVTAQRSGTLWVHDAGTGVEPAVSLRARRGQPVAWSRRFTPSRRGRVSLGPTTVRTPSPLGLWWWQNRLPTPAEIRVWPDFRALRRFTMRSPSHAAPAPVRTRRRPGGESEFERNRPYVAGDPYRTIDWKATARRREFVSREFQQESNQNLIFLLDAGRSAGVRVGDVSSFDHALNAAMMLGLVALKRGDRVGLCTFDDHIRSWVPPRGGVRSGARLVQSVVDLEPSEREPDWHRALRWVNQRVKRRSLILWMGRSLDDASAASLSAVATALGRRHVVVVAWIRDPELEAMAVDRADPWTAAAASEILARRATALSELRRRGVTAIDCAHDQLTAEVIDTYLEVKARARL